MNSLPELSNFYKTLNSEDQFELLLNEKYGNDPFTKAIIEYAKYLDICRKDIELLRSEKMKNLPWSKEIADRIESKLPITAPIGAVISFDINHYFKLI